MFKRKRSTWDVHRQFNRSKLCNFTMADCKNKAIRQRINELADSFEDAWLSGQRPQMSDYWDDNFDLPSQTALFRALLELEMFYCQKNGLAFDRAAIAEKFSQHASLISTVGGDEAMVATAAESRTPVDSSVPELSGDFGQSSENPPPKLVAGQTFGRYQIHSILGQGAMGEVYLAEDTMLHRKVALKVPRFPPEATDKAVRFLREAKMAAAIQHANICPIYDIGVHEGIHYISMAYIPGECLADRLKSTGPLEGKEVARILLTLAMALEEAHNQGVVHRDLKPANVMINQKGEPIVTDFGLARQESGSQVTQLTHSGMILGSPAYMSPEQIQNSAAAGPSSDIYSLGIMMYQLLTGELPYRGDILSLIGKIATEAPPAPSAKQPDIHPGLEAICLKAISKRPESRFESMADFAEALRGYESVSQPPEPLIETASAPKPQPSSDQQALSNLDQAASSQKTASSGRRNRWSLPAAFLLGSAALGYWLLGTIFWFKTDKGFIRVEINDPSINVMMNSKGISISGQNQPQTIEVALGVEQSFKIQRGDFAFETESFVLKDGETTRIKIDFVAGELIATRDDTALQLVPPTSLKSPSTQPAFAASTTEKPHDARSGRRADSTGNQLENHQLVHLNQLLSNGVRLQTGQNQDLPMPITKQHPGIWAIDTTGYPGIQDDDLDLLFQVVPSCIRLALHVENITDSGWTLVADYDCTELMLVGKSPDASAWAKIGAKTELTAFEPRFFDLKDSDLNAISGLVNVEYFGVMFTPITGASFSSLSDLRGLISIDLMGTSIRDEHLPKLAKLPALRLLGLSDTQINGSGLKALQHVESLRLSNCPNVTDISSISSLPLSHVDLVGTSVNDLSPLKDLKLLSINLDYVPERDRKILEAIPTLEFINGQPAESFLQQRDSK